MPKSARARLELGLCLVNDRLAHYQNKPFLKNLIVLLFQWLVQYYFCATVTNLDELTSYIIIKEEDYDMLVKFGNTGFQKFLWRSNWSDFLGIFLISVITKWTACSPNTQKSWREAPMTGKFVILFLQKSEAEKTNKMAMQSLPPFELPTNFKKRDHMSCSSLVITFMIKRFQTRIFFFFSLCLFTQLQEGTNDNLLGVILRKASREGPASMLFGALCYRNRNTLRSWGISLDS